MLIVNVQFSFLHRITELWIYACIIPEAVPKSVSPLRNPPLDHTSTLADPLLKTLWQAFSLTLTGIITECLYSGLFVFFILAVLSLNGVSFGYGNSIL